MTFNEEKMEKILFSTVLFVLLFSGCATSGQVDVQEKSTLTSGTVQRNIKKGMSSADVVTALGSPNIVTRDDQGKSVWVYDKVSTKVQSNSSSAGLWLLMIGASSGSVSSTTSQTSLTIIIKFDENDKVESYTFRQAKF